MRTLVSKKLRALLYYEHDGKCAICGCELPDDWHADHIVPWVVSHETNVHDMQPLCPNCNRAKGTKMLRKHQAELQRIAIDIRTGRSKATNILAHVTPGGGKSAFGMIIAKELAEPLGYKICWVVPRDALRRQGERNFVEQVNLFGHTSRIRAAGNETNPSRGEGGCVVTYQAITANPDLWEQEFRRKPYILILDECHHVPDKGDSNDEEARYFAALAPLVRLAKIRVFASGTLQRHDGHKIAFIRYEPTTAAETPSISPSDDWAVIRYKRTDALEEGAIVPLHFQVMDGRAQWFDEYGNPRTVKSIAASEAKDQAAILRTVLETKYAHDLIDRCLQSWIEHRQIAYPDAKMLVIAPTQEIARAYMKYLDRKNVPALLAISEDTEQAQRNIDAFKRGETCLVTVGMAYEGLDVPEITHVALLTNIRSRPWIEQAICRANRTESRGGKTHGYIFLPDDPRMKSIMEAVELEQQAVVSTVPERREAQSRGGERISSSIAPVTSFLTGERGQGLEDGTRLGYKETEAILEAMRQTGMKGSSPIQFKQALTVLGLAVVPNGSAPEPDYNESVIQATPSEQEAALKKSIYRQVNRIGKDDAERIIRINSHLFARFGDRGSAPIPVLQQILSYVNGNLEALAKL
ncbi:MAG: HNH endonuclease [Caldilineaceae bacterium]